jgi:hypothetical protein
MLFQHGALFSAFTVFANIAFPLREFGVRDEGLLRDLVLLKMAMVELEPDVACACLPSFPAAWSSASPWPAPWPWNPNCWCWTNPPPVSIRI